MNYTKGPWIALDCHGAPLWADCIPSIYTENREVIAEVSGQGDQNIPNARLIAAAPELLNACREARSQFKAYSDCSGIEGLLAEVIAKAEGKQT